MRLIDAEALQEAMMKYITKGGAENALDCAEFNRMIKDAPTVDIDKSIKRAVRNLENYKVVDGYIHVQIYEVEQAIDKAFKTPE